MHNDAPLRDDLAVLAAQARPPSFTADSVIAKVKRRRRRAVAGAAAGTATLVLGVVAVTSWLQGGAPEGGRTVGGPPASQDPLSTVYMCGERLVLPDAATSRYGLSARVSAGRGAGTDVGPTLEVTFTATTTLQVTGSPSTLFEVLYLKDGVIVGGGPLLNRPGDRTPQGVDLIGASFDVAPDRPSTQALGPRDGLCPSLSWSAVWSSPQSYEVVVVPGSVEAPGPNGMVLGVPLPLDAPLLVARAPLTR